MNFSMIMMSVTMIMMISDDYYDVDEGVSSPICLVAPAASKCNINTLAKLLLLLDSV